MLVQLKILRKNIQNLLLMSILHFEKAIKKCFMCVCTVCVDVHPVPILRGGVYLHPHTSEPRQDRAQLCLVA